MLNILLAQFVWPIILVVISVLLVRGLIVYGGIQTNALGYDMTVFTYGFMCDLIVRALQGQRYWPHYPQDLVDQSITQNLVLTIMAICTFVLLLASLWVEKKLAHGNPALPPFVRWFYRGIIFLCAFVMIVVVVGASTLWGN